METKLAKASVNQDVTKRIDSPATVRTKHENPAAGSKAATSGRPTKGSNAPARRKRLHCEDILENMVGSCASGVSCNPVGWIIGRPIKESLATSLSYVALMLLAVACCMVLSSDWFSFVIYKQETGNDEIIINFWLSYMRKWISYYGVYRICSVMVLFHATLAVATLGAPNSSSLRGCIHHGHWMAKYTVLFMLLFLMMYVPLEIYYVRITFTLTCVIGGLLFTVLKFLALVEDFYVTHQSYSKLKHESIWMRLRYYAVTVLVTLVNWALILIVCIITLLCRRKECRPFEIVIYAMTVLCFLLSLVSAILHRRSKLVLKKQAREYASLIKQADDTLKREEVRKRVELGRTATATLKLRKSRSGWFEGSLVSLYVLYLTLAAIDTLPPTLCSNCTITSAETLAVTSPSPAPPTNSNVTFLQSNTTLQPSITSTYMPKQSSIQPKVSKIKIPNLGSVREYEDNGKIYVSCTFYRALIGLVSQPIMSLINLEVDWDIESPTYLREALHIAVRFYAYIGLLVMTILTCVACVKLSRQTSDYGDTLLSVRGQGAATSATQGQKAVAAATKPGCSTSKSTDNLDAGDSIELTAITIADRGKSCSNLMISGGVDEPDSQKKILLRTKKRYPQFGAILRDEMEKTRYSYSVFHLIFMGAYLYVMATLTNWYNPKTHATIEKMDSYIESYVIRMVSAGTVFCAYLFRLLFPRTSILPDTVFKRYRTSFIHAKLERKRNESSKTSEAALGHF